MLTLFQGKLTVALNQPIMVAMAIGSAAIPSQLKMNADPQILSDDRSSAEGKFGWTQFGRKPIPYLFRSEEKYVSLEMMRCQVFNAYTKYFSSELHSCFAIFLYNMTSVEAALLNEINVNHSNNLFGNLVFTTNDSLITLEDANNIHTFLHFCYDRLIRKNGKTHKLCGFMQINSQNCIPYIWHNYRQYVPLFYIDGECKYLKERSIVLTGWPLAYLKLCCKIHGIGKSQFDHEFMTVVDLELVKKFFPPGTAFEDSWPPEAKTECLLKQKVNKISKTVDRNSPENVQCAQVKTIAEKIDPTRQNLNFNPTTVPKIKFVPRNPPPYPATKDKPLQSTQNDTRLYINTSTLTQRNTASSPNNTMNELKQINNTASGYRVLQIPDFNIPSGGCPYFYLRTQFGSKFLNWCINFMPFDSTVMLVTVEEVVSVTQIPLSLFVQGITSLNFSIYMPNTYQKKVLAENKLDQTIGLIKVYNLMQSINNIRNICFKLSLEQ